MTPPAFPAMTMDLDTPLRRLLATMHDTVTLRMAVKALTEQPQEVSTSLTPPDDNRTDERTA